MAVEAARLVRTINNASASAAVLFCSASTSFVLTRLTPDTV
jgi:hypothetical protein